MLSQVDLDRLFDCVSSPSSFSSFPVLCSVVAMVSHLRSGFVVACVYACYMYLHWRALPTLYQEPGELEAAFLIERIPLFPSIRHPVSCVTHLLASLLLTYLCYHLIMTSLRLQFGIGMSITPTTTTTTTTSITRIAAANTLSLSPKKPIKPTITTTTSPTSTTKTIVLTPRACDLQPPSPSRERCLSGAGVAGTRMFPLKRHSRVASRHYMPISSRIAPVTTTTSTSLITSPVLPFGSLRSLATSTTTTTTTMTKPSTPSSSPSPSVCHGKIATLHTTTTVHVQSTSSTAPSIMSLLSMEWLTDPLLWDPLSTLIPPPDITQERAQQLHTQRSTHHTCCTSFRLWHLINNILFSIGIITYLFASGLSHIYDIDTLAFKRAKQVAYVSILVMLASIDCVVYGLYHVGGRHGQKQKPPRTIMHVVMTWIWIIHTAGAVYICSHAHPVIDHRVSFFFLCMGMLCLTLCISVTIAAFRVRVVSTPSSQCVKRNSTSSSISQHDITSSSSTIAEEEGEDDEQHVIPDESDADIQSQDHTVKDVIGPQHAILVLKPLNWCGLIAIMALICHVTNLPVLSPGVICGHEVCHMLLVACMFLLWSYMYSLVLGWPDIPIEFRPRKLYSVTEDTVYYQANQRYKHQSF